MRTPGMVVVLLLSMSSCVQPIAPEEDPKVVEAAPYRCGPDTCRGCCVGDVCREGFTDRACGQGGGSCRSCGEGTLCSVRMGQCESTQGAAPGPQPTLPPDKDNVGKSNTVKTCVVIGGVSVCY